MATRIIGIRLPFRLVGLFVLCGLFARSTALAQQADSLHLSYYYSFIHDGPLETWLRLGESLTFHDGGGCDIARCEASATGELRAFNLDCGSSGSGTYGPWVTSGCSTAVERGYTVECCILQGAMAVGIEGSHTEVEVAGTVITYSYTVTNVGHDTLTGVAIVDDRLGAVQLSDVSGDGVDIVAPADTEGGTLQYIVTLEDLELGLPLINQAIAQSDQTGFEVATWTVELLRPLPSGMVETQILPSTTSRHQLGNIKMSGDFIMAGPLHYEGHTWVFVYQKSGSAWADGWTETVLTPDVPTGDHFVARFGQAFDIVPPYAFVSAPGLDKVFVYRYDGQSWSESQRLDVAFLGDPLGRQWLDVEGNLAAVVGTVGTSVFRLRDGQWVLDGVLSNEWMRISNTNGHRVAIGEDVIVQGDWDEDVRVYRYDNATWSEVQSIVSPIGRGGFEVAFGSGVGIWNEWLAVGAHNHNDERGAIVMYREGARGFSRTDVISGIERGDYVGTNLVFAGGVVATSYGFGGSQRQVWLIELVGGEWQHTRTVLPRDRSAIDYGWAECCWLSIALNEDGSALAVTAPRFEDGRGAIYVYEGLPVSVEEPPARASGYRLFQNYPNPIRGSTTISYELPRASEVMLTVVDLLGRKVGELDVGLRPAGAHELVFDASSLPAGVYFYRLSAGHYVEARQMVVVR